MQKKKKKKKVSISLPHSEVKTTEDVVKNGQSIKIDGPGHKSDPEERVKTWNRKKEICYCPPRNLKRYFIVKEQNTMKKK